MDHVNGPVDNAVSRPGLNSPSTWTEQKNAVTVDIGERATENLRFIRGAMERAERLSAVSGAGLMLVGLVAAVTMAIAADLNPLHERPALWIGAAFVAFAGLAPWLKTRRNRLLLIGDPGDASSCV